MPVFGFGSSAPAAASPAPTFVGGMRGRGRGGGPSGAAVATLGQVAAVVLDTDTLSMPALPPPRGRGRGGGPSGAAPFGAALGCGGFGAATQPAPPDPSTECRQS
jgi:hypothetical protein